MSTDTAAWTGRRTGGLGVLAFRGPDAAKFLQGQLSADTEALVPGTSTLAGLHNPQGRVIAVLVISRTSPEDFFAVLPEDLLDPVAQRLRKYVLRSKVRIESPGPDSALPALPAGDPVARDLDAVRRGIPQVYAATSEQFVAQMLNLDLLGAVDFDKGCYTGQEVVARAHYRGRVKRRMQRWLNTSGTALNPGDTARGPDGRALQVVRGAPAEAGQEILAVGTFGEPETASGAPAGVAQVVVVSGPLPLPYSLPV
jgi:tRNA-modifying protein YgfZ